MIRMFILLTLFSLNALAAQSIGSNAQIINSDLKEGIKLNLGDNVIIKDSKIYLDELTMESGAIVNSSNLIAEKMAIGENSKIDKAQLKYAGSKMIAADQVIVSMMLSDSTDRNYFPEGYYPRGVEFFHDIVLYEEFSSTKPIQVGKKAYEKIYRDSLGNSVKVFADVKSLGENRYAFNGMRVEASFVNFFKGKVKTINEDGVLVPVGFSKRPWIIDVQDLAVELRSHLPKYSNFVLEGNSLTLSLE